MLMWYVETLKQIFLSFSLAPLFFHSFSFLSKQYSKFKFRYKYLFLQIRIKHFQYILLPYCLRIRCVYFLRSTLTHYIRIKFSQKDPINEKSKNDPISFSTFHKRHNNLVYLSNSGFCNRKSDCIKYSSALG